MTVDVEFLRKVAQRVWNERALEQLTVEEDESLDHVFQCKAAQVEDRELFKVAERIGDDPFAAYELLGGTYKSAADMPSFLEQDRPKKTKEIYSALKRDHPEMPAEVKARIAARQGKRGHQEQGPPYKGPITKEALGPLMFHTQPAPDPRSGPAGIKPPSASSTVVKPPSISSGSASSVSTPSISGATGTGAGDQ